MPHLYSSLASSPQKPDTLEFCLGHEESDTLFFAHEEPDTLFFANEKPNTLILAQISPMGKQTPAEKPGRKARHPDSLLILWWTLGRNPA